MRLGLKNAPELERRGTLFLILLTLGIGGLQGVFAVQFAGGSPYLASLGFNKALIGLVWAAAPISGTFGQAYFGLCSDQSRHPWGKRRPYIAAGALAMTVSLLGLAWTEELTQLITTALGHPENKILIRNTRIFVATFCVYALNLAVQPVQGGIRALFVETCPTEQLDDACAWSARMTGIGNLFGYGSGFVDLPNAFPFLGNSQFKILTLLASFSLAITISITCLAVHERDPSGDEPSDQRLKNFTAKFKHILSGFNRMPPDTAKVCRVQFASWSAWFVFLYYITTYIGQIYNREQQPAGLSQLVLYENATREGFFALLVFAAVSLIAGVCIPRLVSPKRRKANNALSQSLNRLSLQVFWLLSHVLFAICMFSTLFVTTVQGTTALVGIVGISWAMTCWIPYALISTELSRLNTNRWQLDGLIALESKEFETQPGVVIGLHHTAIAAPQLVSTLASSAIFWIWKTPDGTDDESVGWVLRAAGVLALFAAYLSTRLREPRLQ